MSELVVVKVGGSLLNWPELPIQLNQFLDRMTSTQILLIAGGGKAADLVRDFDRIHMLGEAHAHILALHSLDLTAHSLAAVLPRLQVVEFVTQLDDLWAKGEIPLLSPRLFLGEDEASANPLPHRWEVTTDSIAARVAVRLHARELILLKSISVEPGTSRIEAARLGLVDPFFPEAAAQFARVLFKNLREPNSPVVQLA